jgi:hypothetical protein
MSKSSGQGPPLESDRGEQIKLVQNFITEKVHGICLAPLDSQRACGSRPRGFDEQHPDRRRSTAAWTRTRANM